MRVTMKATSGVQTAVGTASAAGALVPGSAAPESPLGAFNALLLTILTQDTPPAISTEPSGTPDLAVAAAEAVDTLDPGALVADLLDALSALEIALAGGAPPEPATIDTASKLIDRLATALGLNLPLTGGAPELPVVPPTAGPELPAAIKELADRLAALARSLEQSSPALAQRLAALGSGIADGEIDLAALAAMLARPAGKTAGDNASGRPLPRTVVATTGTEARLASPSLTPAPLLDAPQQDAGPAGEARRTTSPDPRPGTANPAAGQPAAPATAGTEPPPPSPATAGPATHTPPADARAAQTAYASPRQINLPQVAFEIVRHVQAGTSHFQIRLDPPELGRIDVKLDLDASGNVKARMVVERAETLDLMQRDQRILERALAQAGLDSARTNLEFSLRQNPFSQHDQHRRGEGQTSARPTPDAGSESLGATPPSATLILRGSTLTGGVDLVV